MTNRLNVLIIGSGGREHALAWKLAQSPLLGRLYVAPGNAGTGGIAINVPIAVTDTVGLVDFARSSGVDLAIVGPDDALAAGVVDAFVAAGLRAFGPTQAAAQIEASKAFSKSLMDELGVATARHRTFTDLAEAKRYVAQQTFPLVVKASGLALGKGVIICENQAAAEQALEDMLTGGAFGAAGNCVVIEDFLTGQEVSIHAFCDGQTAKLFPSAQDHKRIGTGDVGPNTGGMGTYAPVPWVTPQLMGAALTDVVEPVLAGLAAKGAPFSGLLYPGLMVAADGGVKVLEFNARFGDPEIQSYVRLLESDLLEILDACSRGALAETPVKWSDQTAITVVLASGGYPGKYATGVPITGLDEAAALPDVVVFHAGTRLVDGRVVTAGGRVLGVTATGRDLRDARDKAYAAVKLIAFDGVQYRTDIGSRAL